MPELPEVETSRLGVLPYLKGQVIATIIVRQHKLRWLVDDAIYLAEGKEILDVKRRAKYLLLELQSGWIVIHLGMSGNLRILLSRKEPEKHDHIDVILNNGITLRYNDPRRFGSWLWTPSLDTLPQLVHLGPEPLDSNFSPEYLLSKIGKGKQAVKNWIMDNKVVVGVGNIYASESLFMAKISPQRQVNSLTLLELKSIVIAIKHILARAIELGGTTLKDFLQSDGKPGYFAQQLQVYGRAGAKCYICNTKIASIKIGQRNSFFCPSCQK